MIETGTAIGISRSAAGTHPARRARRPHVDVALFLVLMLAAATYLMVKADGNTFFYDDWTWLVHRRSGLHAILASYNNHMLIAPTALYQLLFHTVGLRDYWVFRLIGTLAHVALATAIFVYARRRIGAAAVLLVLPFLVFGSGWEYVIWPINVGFISSVALGICALLALERGAGRPRWPTLALLVVGLACSEFALVFALAVAVDLTWRERSLRGAWVWAVALVLYAAWWAVYHQPSPGTRLDAAPAFAADLAAGAAGGLAGLGIDWGRPLLVALLVAIGWRLRRPLGVSPRLSALLVAAGAFWLLVAFGRSAGGDPSAPRYIYTGAVLLILILAELLRDRRLPARIGPVLAAVLAALFAAAGNVHDLVDGSSRLHGASAVARAELGALSIARPFVRRGLLVDPHYMPGLTAGQLLTAFAQLHSNPGDPPTAITAEGGVAAAAADRLLFQSGDLHSSTGGARTAGGPPPAVESYSGGRISHARGCVRFKSNGAGASIDLRLPSSGLVLRAAPGPAVAVYARRFAQGFGISPPYKSLAGGHAVTVRVRPDNVSVPWSLRISPNQTVFACTAA